jgi:hypothetical protein
VNGAPNIDRYLLKMRTPTLLITASLLTSIGANAEVSFVTDIAPILESRCLECHGPKKQKGKLRLDSAADAFKEDYVIVKGDAEESELLLRITLPEDDDDIMPPKGDPLTEAEQNLIRDWINGGATWPEGLVIGPKEEPGSQIAIDWPEEHTPSDAETAAIAKLNGMGISVRPIAQNSKWLTANLRVYSGELNDDLLETLGTIVGLVDLNLASTGIDDAQLGKLGTLKNLMTLHLENTKVTDAGLKHLSQMEYLHYLNLYGNAITDDGLASLDELKRLRKLYLWQTKVTQAGVAKLAEAIPGIDINTGESLVVAQADDEEGKASKEEKE